MGAFVLFAVGVATRRLRGALLRDMLREVMATAGALFALLIGATTLLVVNYVVVRFFYTHEKLDRLIEGDEDVLMDEGEVKEARLKKELITRTELEAAARRQGFASLAEVERAVLEPGGMISFIGKKPSPEATRHDELMAKLDDVLRELAELKKR